jgi:hypothetical protein
MFPSARTLWVDRPLSAASAKDGSWRFLPSIQSDIGPINLGYQISCCRRWSSDLRLPRALFRPSSFHTPMSSLSSAGTCDTVEFSSETRARDADAISPYEDHRWLTAVFFRIRVRHGWRHDRECRIHLLGNPSPACYRRGHCDRGNHESRHQYHESDGDASLRSGHSD